MLPSNVNINNKRTEPSVAEYFHSGRSYYDEKEHVQVVKIFAGDYHVSVNKNEMISTILGSCVAACIRDPYANVGGMNHFLLPTSDEIDNTHSDAARYGLFAMESLINGIMKAGGHKDRLEIKVFGGGNVTRNSARIGSKNADFVRKFLRNEGFNKFAEDLEGEYPRRVHYYPMSGKVMMRTLQRREDLVVLEEESRYKKDIVSKPIGNDIELF